MCKIIIGGIVGAVIAFIWQFVSWAVLPWHDATIHQFKNQECVAKVIKENAPVSGIYVYPHYKSDAGTQKTAMTKGPFIYTQIRLCGIDPSSPLLYITSFLTQFVGAALISFLLLQMSHSGYGTRLLSVTITGLIVGVLGFVPSWNWFGASCAFTLVMIADLIITWFLAGLFLAAYAKRKHVA